MHFKNRQEAGQLLAQVLMKYKDQDVVIFALPRGGVVVAAEIAHALNAPLDLILAHKIGHPYQPEYAIAAISENGQVVSSSKNLQSVDKTWFESEKIHQIMELKRKRETYLKGKKEIPVKDKIAIIVDDGIATGATMQAGILDLKQRHPKQIIVAVPVAPKNTADLLKSQVNEFIGLVVDDDDHFLGAVGSYYRDFSQTEDEEVIDILKNQARQST